MANRITRGFINKFNRGEIDQASFAREDVEKIDNSCQLMLNFMPERVGPMSYRPGTETFDTSPNGIENYGRKYGLLKPFITDLEDPILLVFALTNAGDDIELRFFRPSTGAFIERAAVTSGWVNGDFSSAIGTGWIDADEGSATSAVVGSLLTMSGTGNDAAKVYQTSTSTEANAQHGFRVTVQQGQVRCQLGTAGVDSSDLFDGFLELGDHYLEVDPGGDNITMTLSNANLRAANLSLADMQKTAASIVVSLEGALNAVIMDELTTAARLALLRTLRSAQANDVMYFVGGSNRNYSGFIPFEVRRWGETSFSLQRYVNVFGPYENINISEITMQALGTIDGNMVVSASKDFWESPPPGYGYGNSVEAPGVLFKVAVDGQVQTATGSDNNVETAGVFVFGTGDARNLLVTIDTTGTYNDVELQKSFDEISWQTVKNYTSGADVTDPYDDGLDNAELFYRLNVIDIGAATTITVTLDYDYGTLEFEGRITQKDTATNVDVEWYVPFNGEASTAYQDWTIGTWGGRNRMPSAIALYEGRLWFAGNNKVNGSESDFYESHDRFVEGASAAIQKTIAFGATDEVHWLAGSARLVVGTPQHEIDVRSSAFGEVLTDLNTNLKIGSDVGTARVEPIVMDHEIIFVQRGGNKLIGVNFDTSGEKHDVTDFNLLNLEILREGGGVVQLAYARNPETRVYCVMADGTMRVLLLDVSENVIGWSRITVVGNNQAAELVTSVAVIPGTDEDQVFITTENELLLRFAEFSKSRGENDSRHFDRFTKFTSPGTTITLPASSGYLPTHTVGVWVDGADDGDYVINGSYQITGVTSGTDVVVGYRYNADFISNKLTDYADEGVINLRKRILDTGLVMKDYVAGSVQVGPSLTELGDMPDEEDGQAAVNGDYDYFAFPFPGRSRTDQRLAIRATGPCRIMALSYNVKATDSKTRET